MTTRIGLMYDFDHTLCTRDMQEYGFIPDLGMDCGQFWQEVNKQTHTAQMDSILSYLYYMLIKSQEKNLPLTKQRLTALGKDIEFFPGVDTWFSRINEYGKSVGVNIEHYIISSGLKEIISGTSIAPMFKEIYASEYHYDDKGNADWPAMSVNFTNKTQFLFRIHKGTLGISDERVNDSIPSEEIYIPYANMFYFGDGLTDIPCMSLVKKYGGHSFAVYTQINDNTKKLIEDDRVNFTAVADYRDGSMLDTIVKTVINTISLETQLRDIQNAENRKLRD